MEQDEIEVKGPGGLSGRARGHDVLIVMFAFACTAFIWVTEEQRSRTDLDSHRNTQQLLGQVISNQNKIIDNLQRATTEAAEQAAIQTYVLTLSQQQRDGLNLAMPPALRKQLLYR